VGRVASLLCPVHHYWTMGGHFPFPRLPDQSHCGQGLYEVAMVIGNLLSLVMLLCQIVVV
jgi:hypothetical protein